jgi:hypothetical protein
VRAFLGYSAEVEAEVLKCNYVIGDKTDFLLII